MKMKKKEIIDNCKKILSKSRLSKKDANFVSDVYELRWGKSKNNKFSMGRPSNPLYKNYKCFFCNGKEFSYMKCVYIPKDEQEHKNRVKRAFRTAIDYQVTEFRKKGKHVDHVIPFHVIMSDFFIDNNLYFKDVSVYEKGIDWFIKDRKILANWEYYHAKNAKLRVISAQENIRKGREEDLQMYLYRKKRGQTYDRT